MTVIGDKDEDGLASHIAPPPISYRKWGIELHMVSCSTSQPFYIGLGGRNLHRSLHDKRMSGRDLAAERGAASVPNRPVRTPGPWRPTVPPVPGRVGKDGWARRPSFVNTPRL